MTNQKTDVWRGSIDDFCVANNTTPAKLSRCVKMKDRQQIYNYIKSKRDYIVEHDKSTGDIRIIRAETVVNEGAL